VRPNKHICVVLDGDAESLLRAMVPGGRGFGALLSELVRREAKDRVQRPLLEQALRNTSGRPTRARVSAEAGAEVP
jgi:hypothetical protein